MRYLTLPALLAVCALGATVPVHAQRQEWRPPPQMPSMPTAAEMSSGWRGDGPWLEGAAQLSGVPANAIRVTGETPSGRSRANYVRFLSGHRPVAVWSDRNGDERADMVEIFRNGARVMQVIDADFDGRCNLYRGYSPSGELVEDNGAC